MQRMGRAIDACIANEWKATNGSLGFQTLGFPKRIIFNEASITTSILLSRQKTNLINGYGVILSAFDQASSITFSFNAAASSRIGSAKSP